VAAPIAPVEMKPPANLHGFKLLREEYVAEYDAKVFLFEHEKTGAEVMSLSNDDENKTFGVTFRTPPANSTGIPHILEHSVLCGSRKYPIKEPFVELIKGSLNTFLNAMTYPDRTCYPVASCNLQDFKNLVDVYLDAVFHPRCMTNEKTFLQEGWHYELDSPEGEMTFKGVVFNEMKGVYSSPDSVLAREAQQALFPDNTYGVDSGGDPRVIPDLSFEEFKAFHGKFYHPSNARLWFYGDDDVEERLELLDSFLSEFEREEVDSSVATQPFFAEPKRVVASYVAGEGEEQQKSFVQVNWLLNDGPFDQETALAVGFLDNLLMGSPAAPLRMALEESGLGEAIVGWGLEDELRQPTFAIGLKGVAKEDIPKVEKLIEDTIASIAKEGFTQAAIDSSVNTIEFSMRENNTGRFPRGLSLMLRSLSAWLYDGDPVMPLRFEEPLAQLKKRMAEEDVFRPLIKKLLIDNTHQVTIELNPDKAMAKAQDDEEKARIAAYRAGLSPEEIEKVVAETEELKRLQETPDSPEALACVPTLLVSDIPKEAKSIPTDVTAVGATEMLTHDIATAEILYAEHLMDLHAVPMELMPLVPLWCRAMQRMGTAKRDFVEFDQTIGATTGGFSLSPFASSIRGTDDVAAYLVLRGKSTAANAGVLHDLMAEMLLEAKLDDREIFKQLVLESRAGAESRVQSGGHSVAAGRLDAMDSVAGYVNEQLGGLAQLEYLKVLAERVEKDWDGVVADLEAIRAAVVARAGSVTNLTADAKTLESTASAVESFLNALPATGAGAATEPWSSSLVLPSMNELITVPTQVNYVGKGANLYAAGYDLHGSAYVINKLLGTTWLWDRVRVSGGAYGGFSDFDSHSGMFSYLSYRDPNLMKTVANYDGTVDFLKSLDIEGEELTKSIIGTMGDLDAYQLPDAKGYTALMRHLLKVKDEERQQRREEVLGTTQKDFRAFGETLEAARGPEAKVVAVCSPEAAAAAQKEAPELEFKVTSVM
jgi:Zn-dependent M16 (insulinase) family peptidase